MYRFNCPNSCFLLNGRKVLKFGVSFPLSYTKSCQMRQFNPFVYLSSNPRIGRRLSQVSGWAPGKLWAAVEGTAGHVSPGLHWQRVIWEPQACVTHC